jgi:hypothetical protein
MRSPAAEGTDSASIIEKMMVKRADERLKKRSSSQIRGQKER